MWSILEVLVVVEDIVQYCAGSQTTLHILITSLNDKDKLLIFIHENSLSDKQYINISSLRDRRKSSSTLALNLNKPTDVSVHPSTVRRQHSVMFFF